jgi:hypothetical protein
VRLLEPRERHERLVAADDDHGARPAVREARRDVMREPLPESGARLHDLLAHAREARAEPGRLLGRREGEHGAELAREAALDRVAQHALREAGGGRRSEGRREARLHGPGGRVLREDRGRAARARGIHGRRAYGRRRRSVDREPGARAPR